jgi:foldase protein PrsA
MRLAAVALALSLAGGVTGCGGDSTGLVAVRVGDLQIAKGSIEHWARAIELGGAATSPLTPPRGTARERAVDLLISADWLTGEAKEQGLEVSDDAVERQLQRRFQALPGGRSEFEEEIRSADQTTADVKLEIRAELAAAKLRAMITRKVPSVMRAEIAAYYAGHLVTFRIPDLRYADLIEGIPTRAAAVVLGHRLGPGERFARRALHERVARQTQYEAARRENADLVRTIFAAKPGRVVGPVRFNHRWVLVVVRREVPGRLKLLSEVRGEIAMHLQKSRRSAAALAFAGAYERRWAARTSCRPGFVVRKCSQYSGLRTSEANPLLDS